MTVFRDFFSRERLRFLLGVCITALCLLVLLCNVRVIYSSGRSMEPTLNDGHLLVAQAANPLVTPRQGDVAILHHEGGKKLIKRLIATPGDTLEIRSNQVYVNGKALEESYLDEAMVTADVAPVTLGADEYYVLGDNRNNSADSRYYGLFSRSDIIAVVHLPMQALQWVLVIAWVAGLLCWVRWTPLLDDPRPKQTETAFVGG